MAKQGFFSNTSKNVLTLMSGTMISQLVVIGLSPILTRIYTADDYGILGVFTSLIAIIAVISTLRFEAAILLPKDDSEAIQLFKLSGLLILITAFISLIVLLFASDWITNVLNVVELKDYIYLIVISFVSVGVFNVCNATLNRFKGYKEMASTNIVRNLGISFSQLGFGISNFGFKGLVFGRVIGDFLSFIVSLSLLVRKKRFSLIESPLVSNIRKLFRRYEEFPKITSVHALINTASASLPILLLSSFFTTDSVGYYNLSIKIVFLPITLISASTYQVFSRRVTEIHNSGKPIEGFTKETLKKLFLIGFVPFVIGLFFSPEIFSFVFGADWKTAGEYTQILLPYVFLVFLISPLAYIPILKKKQRTSFSIELVYLFARILALLVGIYYENIILAISLYSAVGVIIQLILMTWFFKLSRQ